MSPNLLVNFALLSLLGLSLLNCKKESARSDRAITPSLKLSVREASAEISAVEGQNITFQLEIEPSSEEVKYSCQSCPEDMTIDSEGLVQWAPDYTSSGVYNLNFSGSSHGMTAETGLRLTVAQGIPPSLELGQSFRKLRFVGGILQSIAIDVSNFPGPVTVSCVSCSEGMTINGGRLSWLSPVVESTMKDAIELEVTSSEKHFSYGTYTFHLEIHPSELSRMKNVCSTTANGVWDDSRDVCICDNSSIDRVFHFIYNPQKGTAKCSLDIDYSEIYQSECRLMQNFPDVLENQGIDGLQACLDNETIDTISMGLSLKVISPSKSDPQLVKLVETIQRRSHEGKETIIPHLPLRWTNQGFSDHLTLLVGKPESGNVFSSEQVRTLYEDEEVPMGRRKWADTRFLYEPDPEKTYEAFEKRIEPIPTLSVSPSDSLAIVSLVYNQHYLSMGTLSDHSNSIRTSILRGKADSFFLETPMVESGIYTARRRTYYIRDVPYLDLIHITTTENKEQSIKVILSPTGLVSIILNYTESMHDLSQKIVAYDRYWNSIGEFQRKIDHPEFPIAANRLTEVRDALSVYSSTEDEAPTIGVCEFGYKLNDKLMGKIALGPSESSAWGWYNGSESVGLRSVLGGFGGDLFSNIPDLLSHGSQVAASILEVNGNAKIAPLGLRCYLNELWEDSFDNLKKENVKVVSISNTMDFGYEYCMNKMASSISSEDFLFVVGAGNDGIENPDFRCPQHLSGKENSIIVTGYNVTNMLFDHGLEYADIIAETNAPGSSYRGSSFAAPRVASLAATILGKRDLGGVKNILGPKHVRLAILLSAIQTAEGFMSVRSGGQVDYDRSWVLAEKMNQRLHENGVISKSDALDFVESLYAECNDECLSHKNLVGKRFFN